MKKHYITFLLVLFLISGLSLLLYPTVSDWWNAYHQSEVIAGYVKDVENLDDKKAEEMLASAEAYNQSLEKGIVPTFRLSQEETTAYENILNITGTGIMGYVEIPKFKTSMPIYHGTDEAILQVAIGHIPGSSLPVGGQGSHSVISGHRGLPSAKLFTDIDKLKNGDIFKLHVLGKTLTYQVDQSLTVEPNDITSLGIDPEQDYCTLVTCTPYAVNTHRLLVRGHRIANESSASAKKEQSSDQFSMLNICLAIAGLLLLLIIVLVYRDKQKKKRREALRRQIGRRSVDYARRK